VLTAAHCITGSAGVTSAAQLSIVAGRHDLTADDGQRIQVSEVIYHPAFWPVALTPTLRCYVWPRR
jgi:hypothetical protein